ncbi:MAG: hypothetical protein QW582_02885, partial [Candidatus Micrarchaeaceae archaeon]
QNGSIVVISLTGKAATLTDIKKLKMKFLHIREYTIAGVKGISSASIHEEEKGVYNIIAMGNNIEGVLEVKGVDKDRIYCNDPFEVAKNFGIEAARYLIFKELLETMKSNGISIDQRHLMLLSDAMTYTGKIKSVGRHGIAGTKNSVLAKAAYEETVKHFVDAAMFAEVDPLNGVSENILIGKQIKIGTGRVNLMIKKEALDKIKAKD